MAHDPIERLLAEHLSIMRQASELREAAESLERAGEAALPGALPVLRATVRMIDAELLSHARREDDVLFPALERELGEDFGPTAVMRDEHRAIHEQAERFRSTLRRLNEVEHPAIVAAGERLRALAAAGGDAAALAATARALIALLDEHFAKEEQVLFPMAREVLDAGALAAIASGMDALDPH